MKEITLPQLLGILADIAENNTTSELQFTDEDIAEPTPEKSDDATPVYTEPGDDNYNGAKHVVQLVDQIIVKTLTNEGKLEEDTVNTILYLSQLRLNYMRV